MKHKSKNGIIMKSSIKEGNGTEKDPYRLGE